MNALKYDVKSFATGVQGQRLIEQMRFNEKDVEGAIWK